jgi:ABC-type multidrug transport system ATPase subunit
VIDKPCAQYSGGMKRRLSFAVACIGDPRVLMLDEPTTGMDPMTRRFVWDYVHETKRRRVVLLTTHSMEEADALGDRIGIMSQGALVALGTSLHLKNKFGDGCAPRPRTPTRPSSPQLAPARPSSPQLAPARPMRAKRPFRPQRRSPTTARAHY